MHDIERELIEITGYKPARKFANRQDYLNSILNAVIKLSEDQFDNLTNEAAEWSNAAVEAKNSKAEELPDFDEITLDDTLATVEHDAEAEELGEVEGDPDEEEVGEEVQAEPAPETKPKRAAKPKSEPKAKKAPKAEPEAEADEELPDVKMDKWGAMEGSKNSLALAMFEKGATTKEIKDALGGTYYNILKRMVIKGHKVEKEGSLVKLTHSDDLTAKAAKKKK